MDEGYTVDIIYLDFAKVFDEVKHRFLLTEMKSFGLGLESIRRWRTLGVHSNAQWWSAELREGPLLLLLFVNDLHDVLEPLTLLFADDVKLVAWRTQNMDLHSSFTATWDWSKKWNLRSILPNATI